MRRIAIIGTTGSGKSWLASRLAARLGLPVVELDALFWAAGWRGVPLELFRHRVEAALSGEGWICAGNYGQVRDLVWGGADTIVWLDLPRPTVLRQLFVRTVRRAWSGEDLWNTGNRESFRGALLSRQSILLYAWRTHEANRARFERDLPLFGAHARLVRLADNAAVARFAAGV